MQGGWLRAALLVAGCSSAAPRESAIIPPAELARAGGVIVYATGDDHHAAIVAVRPNGTGRRSVASDARASFYPAPAPARAAIAVLGEDPDEHVERLVALDGDGPRPLADPAGRVRSAMASPDGAFLVYESDHASFRDIFRVEVATGAVTRLTHDGDGAFEPALSPDGARIAFVSTAEGDSEIHVMNADGTGRDRLTSFYREDTSPAWALDSARIAFVSSREGPERLFVMRADGSGQRRLTDRPVEDAACHEQEPAWSPDGARVAYLVHCLNAPPQLWIVEPATGRSYAVSPAATRAESPGWSPDGRYLAYAGGDDGDLFIARADGSATARITSGPARDRLPRWHAE